MVSDSLDLSGLGDVLSDIKPSVKKSPHSFLGENSSLVNLDNLVTISPKPAPAPVPQGKTFTLMRENKVLEVPFKFYLDMQCTCHL